MKAVCNRPDCRGWSVRAACCKCLRMKLGCRVLRPACGATPVLICSNFSFFFVALEVHQTSPVVCAVAHITLIEVCGGLALFLVFKRARVTTNLAAGILKSVRAISSLHVTRMSVMCWRSGNAHFSMTSGSFCVRCCSCLCVSCSSELLLRNVCMR